MEEAWRKKVKWKRQVKEISKIIFLKIQVWIKREDNERDSTACGTSVQAKFYWRMGKGRAFHRQSNPLLNAKNCGERHATFAANGTSSRIWSKDFLLSNQNWSTFQTKNVSTHSKFAFLTYWFFWGKCNLRCSDWIWNIQKVKLFNASSAFQN